MLPGPAPPTIDELRQSDSKNNIRVHAPVGVDYDRIVEQPGLLLRDPAERNRMTWVNNPYGDGTAARQIDDVLAQIRFSN